MRPYGSEDHEEGRVLIISKDLFGKFDKLRLPDESIEIMLWRMMNVYLLVKDSCKDDG